MFDDIDLNFNVIIKCYASERKKGFYMFYILILLLKQKVLFIVISKYVNVNVKDALMLERKTLIAAMPYSWQLNYVFLTFITFHSQIL